jgi:hypothetical protein
MEKGEMKTIIGEFFLLVYTFVGAILCGFPTYRVNLWVLGNHKGIAPSGLHGQKKCTLENFFYPPTSSK